MGCGSGKNEVQNLFRERLRKDHSPDLQKYRTGTVVESEASLNLQAVKLLERKTINIRRTQNLTVHSIAHK